MPPVARGWVHRGILLALIVYYLGDPRAGKEARPGRARWEPDGAWSRVRPSPALRRRKPGRASLFSSKGLRLNVCSADDGFERVQSEPATRGWHLLGQVQPQHLPIPPGLLLGYVCAPLRCARQLHATQVPAHRCCPGLRLLRRWTQFLLLSPYRVSIASHTRFGVLGQFIMFWNASL